MASSLRQVLSETNNNIQPEPEELHEPDVIPCESNLQPSQWQLPIDPHSPTKEADEYELAERCLSREEIDELSVSVPLDAVGLKFH